jgi:hypothetical protein
MGGSKLQVASTLAPWECHFSVPANYYVPSFLLLSHCLKQVIRRSPTLMDCALSQLLGVGGSESLLNNNLIISRVQVEHISLFFFLIFIVLLFICAYNARVISPPCPHPLPYHPLRPLPLPHTPSLPGRNYFALISNFVVEKV